MANNTIFKSGKISVEIRDNDYRYICANYPIKKGELLLIEHCYLSTTLYEQVDYVQHSSSIFNNLFPRIKKWDSTLINTKEHINLAAEKVQKNVFKINDNYRLIFLGDIVDRGRYCIEILDMLFQFIYNNLCNEISRKNKKNIDSNKTTAK